MGLTMLKGSRGVVSKKQSTIRRSVLQLFVLRHARDLEKNPISAILVSRSGTVEELVQIDDHASANP